ncbi:signal recognition particle 14 kDa protein-like [Bombina bombina]|uniref:signal recognition particle 14 kDa protein-like n=1 Tax=Bombina bombina TaxID=8345 RepID=UPI00235B309E|nr:signal recognition particle 14 kDa protein-like [Bombina bombina]
MVLLESEQFLSELSRLFQKCQTSGSVYITLKKYDGRTKPIPRKGHPDNFEPADNKCLLRATDGKRKISTVVSSKDVNKFQMSYSNLLRANMDGLKKKDKKSKNRKSSAAQGFIRTCVQSLTLAVCLMGFSHGYCLT